MHIGGSFGSDHAARAFTTWGLSIEGGLLVVFFWYCCCRLQLGVVVFPYPVYYVVSLRLLSRVFRVFFCVFRVIFVWYCLSRLGFAYLDSVQHHQQKKKKKKKMCVFVGLFFVTKRWLHQRLCVRFLGGRTCSLLNSGTSRDPCRDARMKFGSAMVLVGTHVRIVCNGL